MHMCTLAHFACQPCQCTFYRKGGTLSRSMVIHSRCPVQSSNFAYIFALLWVSLSPVNMGGPAWTCPHDPVCKSSSACPSERSRQKKRPRADAVLAAAAVAFLAVALKCGELLAARPSAPSGGGCRHWQPPDNGPWAADRPFPLAVPLKNPSGHQRTPDQDSCTNRCRRQWGCGLDLARHFDCERAQGWG